MNNWAELKKIAVYGGTYGLVLLANLTQNSYFSKQLTIEDFGLYSFTMSLIMLIALPLISAVPDYLMREFVNNDSVLKRVLILALSYAMVISLLLFLFAWLQNFDIQMFEVIKIIIMLSIIGIVKGILKSTGKANKAEFLVGVYLPTLLLGLLLAFKKTYATLSVNLIIEYTTYAYFIIFVSCCVFLFLNRGWFSGRATEKIFKPLIYLSLFSLMVNLMNQAGVMILKYHNLVEDIAWLRVAERGAQFIYIPCVLITTLYAPHIIKLNSSKTSKSEVLKLILKIRVVSTAISSLGFVILFFYGREILEVVFSESYAIHSYYPMMVLNIAFLLCSIIGHQGFIRNIIGAEQKTIYVQVTSIAFYIMICLFTAKLAGAIGVAFSFGAVMVVTNLIHLKYVKRELNE